MSNNVKPVALKLTITDINVEVSRRDPWRVYMPARDSAGKISLAALLIAEVDRDIAAAKQISVEGMPYPEFRVAINLKDDESGIEFSASVHGLSVAIDHANREAIQSAIDALPIGTVTAETIASLSRPFWTVMGMVSMLKHDNPRRRILYRLVEMPDGQWVN